MAEESHALDALKQMGKSAVPTLQLELKSERTGHRFKAAWVLSQLGPVARDAVPELIKATDDKDIVVRVYAIRAIAAIGGPTNDLIPILKSKLADSQGAVRNSAAESLRTVEVESAANNISISTNR
jgi:HEAT repeat protein